MLCTRLFFFSLIVWAHQSYKGKTRTTVAGAQKYLMTYQPSCRRTVYVPDSDPQEFGLNSKKQAFSLKPFFCNSADIVLAARVMYADLQKRKALIVHGCKGKAGTACNGLAGCRDLAQGLCGHVFVKLGIKFLKIKNK
jgi:hypothetical protein